VAIHHSDVVVVKRLIMTSVAAAILKLCASLLLMMANTIQFDRIVFISKVKTKIRNDALECKKLSNFCLLLFSTGQNHLI
jgi:hypothetical protein